MLDTDAVIPANSPQAPNSISRESVSSLLKRAVSDLKSGQKSESYAERRSAPRHPYNYTQSIAPWNGERPDESEFHRVRCHNISVGGFSFFWHETPDYEKLVVRLGLEPDISLLQADIVRVVPHESEVLVGCRFVARL